ncbi:MAG: response regulator [Patescibacteria group bacterium]|nr:response regulator [Patescibacteria group bacterium]MDE1940547.1 response regulator [Patescibacteria group bacterium]MDE1966993.1 response regulator [Patescibacteria group bacterium]
MASETKKEKILIIEGDGAFGEKLAGALHDDGFEFVSLVKNGVEGLKAIYDFLPHLVLLDVTLPGIDGYEVLSKKQAEPMLSKIAVFLLSIQGTPINMTKVPAGSVAEFFMALHAEPADIVQKVDKYFGHEPGRKGDEHPSGSKKKLLWVEDDRLIGTILARKLVASGFDLFHAKNGEEALETLKSVKPDAIVVDLILPGMSGFDILQKVGSDESMKSVPKMVLSNLSKPSDIEKARALGAQKFLVKAATSLDQIVQEIKGMCR